MRVKILVLAHKPPPYHGQSYMVEMAVKALGGDVRTGPSRGASIGPFQCYHLDARYSSSGQDVGRARWGKVLLAFKYCFQAIWWRLRFGVRLLYYVPAAPLRTPIYRDWIVLGLCRAFFPVTIFHWQAAGLGEWMLKTARPWERWICRRVYGRPDLSIVLLPLNRADAEQLESNRIAVVANAISDPCPDFEQRLLPRRLGRAAVRQKLRAGMTAAQADVGAASPDAAIFRVLYVSLCYREKGLFDTVEAMAMVHRTLRDSPLRVRLTVAGTFYNNSEKLEFEQRLRQSDLQDHGKPIIEYRGFVTGTEKQQMFEESDCLCFPTYYEAESFGNVLVEGMAYGLAPITTAWRGVSGLLPPDSPGVVAPKSPQQIADAIIAYLDADYDPKRRVWFLAHYTEEKFAENLKRVLMISDGGGPGL